MNGFVNTSMVSVNEIGRGFCNYAAGMFVQSGVLIVALLLIDLTLRKRLRATVRYWIWMLVFIKLLLPPTFALPTGIGYWFGGYVPRPASISPPVPQREETHAPVAVSAQPEVAEPTGVPAVQTAAAEVPPLMAKPVESSAVRAKRLTWQGGVFLFWSIGVLVFTGWVLQRLCLVRRLIARAEPTEGPCLDLLDQCRRRVGVRRQIVMKVSERSFSPAVCGLWRPTILLPASLPAELSPEKLRAVLIHELAHVKRADLWVNCLQTALQIIYFYDPLVWLANAIVRRVREQAVDEMVLVALGAEAGSYGHTLIDIAEMTFLRASPALRLVGVAESKKSLEGRIKHMITRPIPKSARLGRWGLLAILTAAVVLLPMARAEDRTRPTADASGPEGEYGILLLDDKDPRYNDKDRYDDRLYLMDSRGHIRGAVTGLNICQTIGGCHRLALDEQRKTLWVVENVGQRLWHFDLASGKLLAQISLPGIGAVSVDPSTGNVWCRTSDGTISNGDLRVLSPSGQHLATYPVVGYDITYSAHDACFWVAGRDIIRVGLDGKVLGRIAGRIPWTAVSISVDAKTGNAWVVERSHPDVAESRPRVWVVGPTMEVRQVVELADLDPSCVAVDSDHGVAWVGCDGATLRFATSGEKLASARGVSGVSVAPGQARNQVIAASDRTLTMATVGDTGNVRSSLLPEYVREVLSASQKWVAVVPWGGAKLPSSPELARLVNHTAPEQTLARYPGSLERLQSLGKTLPLYARDHGDKLPNTLDDVRTYVSDADLQRLKNNVLYTGGGRVMTDGPDVAVAVDRTMLRDKAGSLVLYLDGRVVFEDLHKLEELIGLRFAR